MDCIFFGNKEHYVAIFIVIMQYVFVFYLCYLDEWCPLTAVYFSLLVCSKQSCRRLGYKNVYDNLASRGVCIIDATGWY